VQVTKLKNIHEVLQEKQRQLEHLQQEIAALHVVVPMLEQGESARFVPLQRPWNREVPGPNPRL